MTLSARPVATPDPPGPPDSARSAEVAGGRGDTDESRAAIGPGREETPESDNGSAAVDGDLNGSDDDKGEEVEEEEALLAGSDELLQGEAAAGYFRNVTALLRCAGEGGDNGRPAGRLLLRSCSHSAAELQQIATRSEARLRFISDLSVPGKIPRDQIQNSRLIVPSFCVFLILLTSGAGAGVVTTLWERR